MTAKLSIKRALISTSDKEGLAAFAKHLHQLNIEIIATGGTAKLLRDASIPVTNVEEVTRFPEIMDGRVKTLHPNIHAAVLARGDKDTALLKTHGITPIDLVVVNLYPFQKTIANPQCTTEKAIENIDIGGPTLLRAAAKNHAFVTVVVDPKDYSSIIDSLETMGEIPLEMRQDLAKKAFAHTAAYDTAIAHYFSDSNSFIPSLTEQQALRYGENPHQKATLYRQQVEPHSLTEAKKIQGKPLSFNNLMDSDAALCCVRALDDTLPGCVIVKHATPCGVAQANSLEKAYLKALATDPISAFGGIIAFNKKLDKQTAKTIVEKQFVEVILAPEFEAAALSVVANKKNIRVLTTGSSLQQQNTQTFHSISGGLLIQDADVKPDKAATFTVVTQRQPTADEMADCLFGWNVVRYVKSNAILYAKDRQTLGIGTGQTSRIFSAKIAALKAKEASLSLTGAAMASDAFFPFADSLDMAAKAGITAVIQPGGSKHDAEIIAAANELQLAMIFTHVRHFKH